MQILKSVSRLRDKKGVTLVFVAICVFMLITFAALSLDIFHLVVTRNELQNAADAGALAGARYLYNEDGTAINSSGYTTAGGVAIQPCNTIALAAATANQSEKVAVEVGTSDVQRGHWSFACKTFTPNNSTVPVSLWNVPTLCANNTNCPNDDKSCLDRDIDFINAVQVTARRDQTEVAAWFSTILNYVGFKQSATAVAYIGFSGSLAPLEADLPVAICKQSILINGQYSCNIGRMLNSGSNSATSNTGGWTNFTQAPCDTANPSNSSVCTGNANLLNFGVGMGTTGGTVTPLYTALTNCAESPTQTPHSTWMLTLPVIDCPGNNVSNCATLVGAVTLKIVWITVNGTKYSDVPYSINDSQTPWSSSTDSSALVVSLAGYFQGSGPSDKFPTYPAGTTVGAVFNGTDNDSGRVRWASLVKTFNLKNATDPITGVTPYATFADKSIYFIPDCTPHEPAGTSQGENFGILAKIPVLVH